MSAINNPIVRLYASAEQGKVAIAALKRWGFEDELLNFVTAVSTPPPDAPTSAASDDPVQSAIMSAYVLKAHAKIYAQEVRSGRSLVSVRAPFGTGGIAEELLDECGPVKSAVDLGQLVDDLLETLYASRAIGLAATQVDVHLQVVVLDVSGDASAPQVFINPQALSQDTICMVEEICLSVPGVVESVRRATRLRVRALDRTGAPCERRVEGVTAVCLLHEMDHLAGRLFVDHLAYLKRLRLRWRLGRERKAIAA